MQNFVSKQAIYGTAAGSRSPISQIPLTAWAQLLAAVLLYKKSALVISTSINLLYIASAASPASHRFFHSTPTRCLSAP